MRIAQMLPELNEGGVERGVVELSREMVKRGHESIVISHGGRLVAQIEGDGGRHVKLDVASKNPLTVPGRVLQLRRTLRNLQPDVIHARSRVPAWLAVLANRNLQIPFVTTVHGFNSVNPYSRIMTLGDQVICVSSAIESYIHEHYGVSADKTLVIPRGVDLELFNPAATDSAFMAAFSAQYRLTGRFVVCSIGRITQLKDYETFIRGIAILKPAMPEILGLIVGGVRNDKQKYFESLQSLVLAEGLSEHVLFVGSQSQVAEIYALSNVVVSSSKKPESFGRSAAEALAMGVPVVASAHGGVLDIVREGETGSLFPPGDAPALAQAIDTCRMLPSGPLREYVAERFTLPAMVDATLAVYEQCARSVMPR